MTHSKCPSLVELELIAAGDAAPALVQHIDACERCRRALDEVLAGNDLLAELASLPATQNEEPEALPDLTHDGYRLDAELHRGGQGVVYRGTQIATNRVVAVKMMLRGAFATPAQRRRFEREIELIAGLRHPNIVTVYDSGLTDSNRLFLVMEFIDGRPLDSVVTTQSAPTTIQSVLDIFIKLCDAIDTAHRRGVIHRDLKPANILIDKEGIPHILDFGLAKAIGPDAMRHTESGAFVGTFAYAAPEQVTGDPSQIDTRTDVYALGLILYELLTAQHAYPLTQSVSEIIRHITEIDPTAPSSLNKNIDRDLETITSKCMAKSPDRRYQSAALLLRDLHNYRSGDPIDARRDSGWYVFRKTAARYRLPITVVASIIGLTLAASIFSLTQYREATLEAEKANTIRIFLEDTLASVEPRRSDEPVTVRETLDEAVHWIEIALADQPEIESSLRSTIGNSYRALGLFQDAERELSIALAIRRGLHGDDHPDIASTLNALGLLRRDQGRLGDADRLITESLAMRRRHLGDGLVVSNSLMNLASVRRATGNIDQAESLLREALQIRSRSHQGDHPNIAMCHFRLAEIATDRNDHEAAAQAHERSLEMRVTTLHPEHPDVIRSRLALAASLLHLGEAERAEQLARESVDTRVGMLGMADWRVAQCQITLGTALAQLERYDEAESVLLTAATVIAEQRGRTSDDFLQVSRALRTLYEALNDQDRADQWRDP